MTPLDECEFRVFRAYCGLGDGTQYEVVPFQKSETVGDWVTKGFFPAYLYNPTPTNNNGQIDFPEGSMPLAFFTGHAISPMDPTENHAAVVCIPIETKPNHTYVTARNSDCVYGRIILHGFGIVETPGRKTKYSIGLRLGTLPPALFMSSCHEGDWIDWPPLLVPNPADPTESGYYVVGGLTATATGFPNGVHVCAPVGVMRVTTLIIKNFKKQDELRIRGRNSDVAVGVAGMNYLIAMAGETRSDDGLWVDTGRVAQKSFLPSGIVGDWMEPVKVKFNGVFAEPPTVLVSPSSEGVLGHIAAPVPIVDDVTPTGFTLLARNTDSVVGMSAFHWAAFGHTRKG